ncbi:phospholipase A2 [Deinococcus marmoris]|uniref:phospholipase A2 n=1 Tax=Deinococcus marmoris TaxID=249408 RepID=UPI000689B99F|nr:phospholipase A2 [Deinococcus marmoris]
MTNSMKNFGLGYLLLGTLVLTSCGSQGNTAGTPPTPAATNAGPGATTEPTVAEQIAAFAQRPELQDADTQAILKAYANDPLLLQGLQEAYGLPNSGLNAEALALQMGQPGLSAQASGKAGYAQGVAWGSIAYHAAERRSPNYSGLNWNNDGCSAPRGLGLGYSDFFRSACNVHDFGYRNLPKLISIPYWPYNKSRTDSAFLGNMRGLCNAKSWYSRPACYAAAQAYYEVVSSAFGWTKWHR